MQLPDAEKRNCESISGMLLLYKVIFSILRRSNVLNTYSLRTFDAWDSFRLSLDALIYFQFWRMFCLRMEQPRHFYLKVRVDIV